MKYDIISTGSKGNAVLLWDKVLIDCGVPFKKINPYIERIGIVLLTHKHTDHFNASTIRRLHEYRPGLMFCCETWLIQPLLEAGVSNRNICVLSCGDTTKFIDMMEVTPERLTHDVENCGYHIKYQGERAFYATDTATLDGITARGYDYYFIEANYTDEEIEERIRQKVYNEEYAYEFMAKRNHLSRQQAVDWLAENKAVKSEVVFLHSHAERK